MAAWARSTAWLGFFALILWAWWAIYAMNTGTAFSPYGLAFLAELCGIDSLARFPALFGMWAVMMAAMMLPTLVPTLSTYERLMVSADGSVAGWVGVVTGYGLVWIGFSVGLTWVQVALFDAGLVDGLGAARSSLLAGALLVAAGAYQFSRVKAGCQSVCLSPFSYFLGNWRPGFAGGVRMGLGLGAYCAGCCWGLMTLAFVGGVMNPVWMGLATLAMVLEKLPQLGQHVTRPMGVALILAGLAVIGATGMGG